MDAYLVTDAYGPRHSAYDLRKLRGKEWFVRSGIPELERGGLRTMTALVVLQEDGIRPLPAASQRPD